MVNFTEEIAKLTAAQTGYALAFLVGRVEGTGEATAADVLQAIENARAHA